MTDYSVYEKCFCVDGFCDNSFSLQIFPLSQKDGAKVVIIFIPHKFFCKKIRENFLSRMFL